jgi:hypothetical protein
MQQIIKNWLSDPKRKYADGLAIFKTAAAPEIKKKYAEFLSSVTQEPKQFDLHFGMLINKVSDIERKIALNPDAFKDMKLVLSSVPIDNSAEIAAKETEIEELKAKLESLTENEKDAAAESTLSELQQELEALKEQRGIQIVHYDNLPTEIKTSYDRVKIITPLMASLHADISVESLAVATRTKLVKQLVDLDDERRAAWDSIDEWSEGKSMEPKTELPLYSDNELIKGAEMARRIIRLKENIARSQEAADKAERETIKASAVARIEKYNVELTELEAIVNKTTDDITGIQ